MQTCLSLAIKISRRLEIEKGIGLTSCWNTSDPRTNIYQFYKHISFCNKLLQSPPQYGFTFLASSDSNGNFQMMGRMFQFQIAIHIDSLISIHYSALFCNILTQQDSLEIAFVKKHIICCFVSKHNMYFMILKALIAH